MTLASMLNIDSDALECDLAETYHIYDMKELPVKKVALFCVGLRDNSRIKMKISNVKTSLETLLLAKISDQLSIDMWIRRGAKEGLDPDLIMPNLIDHKVYDNDYRKDIVSFENGEEFEKSRKKILMGR